MEIVQRDMAARRAQTAAAAEAAAAPAPVAPKRPAQVIEPPSRTGLVPVSTRGIVRPAMAKPAAHATAKSTPAATTAPAAVTAPLQGEPSAHLAFDPSAPVVSDVLASNIASSSPVDPTAPIFPSATAAARKLGPTGTTPGIAVPAATTALAPAAAPVIPITPVEELSRIYSKADPGVTPARLLTTTGTAGLSMDATDVNTMELVINELGRVEQVKLAQPAKRMTDMLLLSGAKMWKFEPATKDGQPVRYRTTVSWQTTR